MNTFSSQKNNAVPRLRPAPLDAVVVLAVLVLAAALFAAMLPKQSGGALACTVSRDGQVLDTFPVEENSPGERVYGAYTVSVAQDGAVSVTAAPCAGQDCVRTGAVRRAGQNIVCLPGRFVVELSGTDGDGSGVDIVVR